MVKIGKWDYKDDVMETVKIKKILREDINKFCKKNNIKKCDLISNFYKAILIKYKDGSLSASNGYITLKLF